MKDRKYNLFISYSRKDLALMQRFKNDVMAAKLTVWTDEHIIPGTPDWQIEIEKAIENAEALAVLLSPDAKQSRWVREELGYANLHEVRIFPVLIRGDKKSSIPFGLVNAQCVDITDSFYDEGINIIINTIRTQIKDTSSVADIQDPRHFIIEPSSYGLPYKASISKHISGSIGIYGPPASGKTTLVGAFFYLVTSGKLDSENAKMGLMLDVSKKDFFPFRLQGLDMLEKGLFPPATIQMDSQEFLLNRIPKTNKPSFSEQISTFSHDVWITDNRGSLYVPAISPSVTSYQDLMSMNTDIANAWEQLSQSIGIIVLLDPTQLIQEDIQSSDEQPYDQITKLTKREYARMVRNLVWLNTDLELGQKRKLAICIAKVDVLASNMLHRSPDEVIFQIFGVEMQDAIDVLRMKFGSENIRTFTLSSLGFDNSAVVGNIGKRNILNKPNHWTPYQVHFPFFWILENNERDFLRYKSPNFPILGSLLSDYRVKNHIPYL